MCVCFNISFASVFSSSNAITQTYHHYRQHIHTNTIYIATHTVIFTDCYTYTLTLLTYRTLTSTISFLCALCVCVCFFFLFSSLFSLQTNSWEKNMYFSCFSFEKNYYHGAVFYTTTSSSETPHTNAVRYTDNADTKCLAVSFFPLPESQHTHQCINTTNNNNHALWENIFMFSPCKLSVYLEH